jgi:rubrerythrin
MTYTEHEISEEQVVLLRCDNCGEGFQWPMSADHPEYCPICGAK